MLSSEKLPEVLNMESLPPAHSEGPSSAEGKDIAFTPPVYPAGILLVCNNCAAYRKLLEAQTPSVRKWALRRQNEPLEVRLQRLERERTAKKSRRDNETPEEREVRRMRDREAKRLQRMQETDEQRARRLQRDREAMRLKRANETPEKRQARLIREREAKRLKRRLEKMDMMLRAQFGQDPSAMAALAAEMNFFQLPVSGVELDSQLLGKMAFEEQNSSSLHWSHTLLPAFPLTTHPSPQGSALSHPQILSLRRRQARVCCRWTCIPLACGSRMMGSGGTRIQAAVDEGAGTPDTSTFQPTAARSACGTVGSRCSPWSYEGK